MNWEIWWLLERKLNSDKGFFSDSLVYIRLQSIWLRVFNSLQELNRIHKAAISIGFHELLTGLSLILERECALLPPSAHPEASMQLQHFASILSKKEMLNINYIIRPLNTNFKPADIWAV